MTPPVSAANPANTPTVTIKKGDTLEQIAQQYGTTVGELLKVNPGLDPKKLQVGQGINIINPRIAQTKEKIDKAVEYGYAEMYDMGVDQNGHAVLTLKKGRQIYDIKQDFQLPDDGTFMATNPKVGQEFKEPRNGYDNLKLPEGYKITVCSYDFNPNKHTNSIVRAFVNAWNRL